jgi:hypothetical protein
MRTTRAVVKTPALKPEPSASAMAAYLTDQAGLRIIALHADFVIAERPVFGVRGAYRRFVAGWTPDHGWRVGAALTEYAPRVKEVTRTRSLDRTAFTDFDALGRFVGGWNAKPIEALDEAALRHSEASHGA